jgi:hypothetical protein
MNKTPGPSGIGYDLLKVLGPGLGRSLLLRLLEKATRHAIIPADANLATITLLPKTPS